MKQFEVLQKLPKWTQSQEVSKCHWKNGADRLA